MFKVKVPAGLVPSEGCEEESAPWLSPSYWWVASNLWSSFAFRHITSTPAFLFTWHSPFVHTRVQISPFYKNIIGLGLTLITSF